MRGYRWSPVAMLLVAVVGGCAPESTGEDRDRKGLCPEPWRTYPYRAAASDIRFPEDEGAHYVTDPSVTMEWWYAIYHVHAEDGREFSIMATFFMPQLGLAFLPFNITDVRAGEMFDTSTWGYLDAVEGSLDLTWTPDELQAPPSTFRHRRDSDGNLVPFGYEQHLYWAGPSADRSQALHVVIDSEKSPYLVGGDGYVTIGESGDSFYYSLTRLAVSGELELNGETLTVSGEGWLDHQWGPFMINPLSISKNSYEWMAIHLDNGDEYMVSTIFDQQNRTHLEEGFGSIGWKTAACGQGITMNHSIHRLAYWHHAASDTYYSHRWRIVVPETGLDVVVEPEVEDQTVAFLNTTFYEGRSRVTGTANGEPVTGLAFAEMVHHYEKPRLSVLEPQAGAVDAGVVTVRWAVNNPDDGCPLRFNVTVTGAGTTQAACTDVEGDSCTADLAAFSGATSITVEGRSVDGVLSGSAAVTVTPSAR